MARRVCSYGLIAGLTYTEMLRMEPGYILYLFKKRVKYDQMMNLGVQLAKALGGRR